MTESHYLETANICVTIDAGIFDPDIVRICCIFTRWIIEYSLTETTVAFTVAAHDLIVLSIIGTTCMMTLWWVVASIPILTEGNRNCLNVDDLISKLTGIQCEDMIANVVSRTTSRKIKH